MLDVVIVGGSCAGLSAALILGRSLRDVVVIDDHKPCNRFSLASHGFLTRDGVLPADLVHTAREQLAPYTSVTLKDATALRIESTEGGFAVTCSDASRLEARRILLATGLRDDLPGLEGIERFWGQSVLHCPYCDGYEIRGKPVAVYGEEAEALHLTLLLRNLTPDVTLCIAPSWTPTLAQRERLARHGIRVVEQPVVAVDGDETHLQALRFAGGSTLRCDALFVRPKTSHRTTFASDLGCEIDERNVVRVDSRGRTSVPGVYAAGDLSSPNRSVALAVAQGAAAAYGLNADLADEDFA